MNREEVLHQSGLFPQGPQGCQAALSFHIYQALRAKGNSCPSPDSSLLQHGGTGGSPNWSVRQHKQSRGSWYQCTLGTITPSFSRKSFVRKMPGGISSFPGNTEGALFQIQASWTPKVITDFGFTLFMPCFMLFYLQVYSARAAPLLSSHFPKLSARVELFPCE